MDAATPAAARVSRSPRAGRARSSRAVAAALVLTALVAAGCTGSDDEDAATTTTAATTTSAVSIAEAADFVAAKDLNGAGLVVVDRDEGVVYEHYVGEEFGPDHLSLIASSSKMITAGVLMRLHDQGLLDVDAPVADAVDWEGAKASNPDVTPAQLVSNSSGLVGLLPSPTYAPYICQYLTTGGLEECGERIFTTGDDDAEVVPPDTEFRYGGGQWQVAGAVAEAVSGRSWAELIDETYVQPCGVDSLAYNNHFAQPVSQAGPFGYPVGFAGDPANLVATDNPNMEGGAYIDPLDYAALLLMHLRGGSCDGGRVLSEESVERMHTDRAVSTYDAQLSTSPDDDEPDDGPDDGTAEAEAAESGDTESEGDPGTSNEFRYRGYGLGWWVADLDTELIEDAGAYGAVPWLDLGRGYGAYLVVEASSSLGRELAREIRPQIETELDALRGD